MRPLNAIHFLLKGQIHPPVLDTKVLLLAVPFPFFPGIKVLENPKHAAYCFKRWVANMHLLKKDSLSLSHGLPGLRPQCSLATGVFWETTGMHGEREVGFLR